MGETGAADAGGKICFFCGEDCSGQARGKDPKGRYYHLRCLEEAKARSSGDEPPVITGGLEIDSGESAGGSAAASRPRPVPQPRPKSAGVAAGGEGPSLLGSLLDEEGEVPGAPPPQQGPGAAAACPSCGAAMQAGAVICTQCGYNVASGIQLTSKTKHARGGGDALASLGILGHPWMIFGLLSVVFIGLFAVARTGEEGMLAFVVLLWLFGLAVYVITIVFAFKDHGILDGILVLICGLYTLIYGLFRAEPRWLRASHGAYLVGTVLFALLYADFVESELFREFQFDQTGAFENSPTWNE